MAKIFVCDVLPGGGKSSAVINMMNERSDERYIYITPYLEEGERIVAACKDRNFKAPDPKASGTKLADLHKLLAKGRNVSSTHSLFSTYTDETIALIQDGGYTLVMDEVFQIAEILGVTPNDISLLERAGCIKVTDGMVEWIDDTYQNGFFNDIRNYAKSGFLQMYENMFFYWYYPPAVFDAFKEIYVLTYMFPSQFLKNYFDVHGMSYQNIWVDCKDGRYEFVDCPVTPDHGRRLKSLVRIADSPRINAIGDGKFDLSSTWYKNALEKYPENIKQMKDNLHNFLFKVTKKKASDTVWTAYTHAKDALIGKGFQERTFIPFNLRATNKYREKTCLAYCVNVFPNPNYITYFASNGVSVDIDGYALSEMVQLLWRTAIREGKQIDVYVPSGRMRKLLVDWLEKLSKE